MHLHETPAKEARYEQSEAVQRQARDLRVRTRPPVVREQVDAACALSRQGSELAVEDFRVDLERLLKSPVYLVDKTKLTIWKPPHAVARMWVSRDATLPGNLSICAYVVP